MSTFANFKKVGSETKVLKYNKPFFIITKAVICENCLKSADKIQFFHFYLFFFCSCDSIVVLQKNIVNIRVFSSQNHIINLGEFLIRDKYLLRKGKVRDFDDVEHLIVVKPGHSAFRAALNLVRLK